MRRRITPEVLLKVADLQKEGLSNTLIALRLGVHVSSLNQAIRNAASKQRGNKFKAEASDGFPSRLEKSVYELLKLRERAKEISDVKRQVRVELTEAAIATKVDFSFHERLTGRTVFCEAKGIETERWIMLKKLWKFYGPGPLEIFKGSAGRPQLVETIIPGGGK